MKLKTVVIDGKTYAEVLDEKPVFVGEDGKDVAFDVVSTNANVTALRGEAMRHRQDKEKAEGALKAFEGIGDPAAALKALDTIKNFDDKKLVDAGEVQRVKDEVAKGYEGKLTEAGDNYRALESRFHTSLVNAAFGTSKFITDKVAAPIDMLQATFGRHFGVDDQGRVIAKDSSGNPIPSSTSFGDPAGFDEAIEKIIATYPHKDHILKGTVGAGGGASGSTSGSSGKRAVTRAEFDKLDPAGKASLSGDVRAGKAEITD